MIQREINDLRELLLENKYMIYGLGKVSEKFYYALKHEDLCVNLMGFIIGGKPVRPQYDGYPTYSITNTDILSEIKEKGYVLCLAVHEALKEVIIDTIRKAGIDDENFVWIYPYLMPLIYGEPIWERKEVKIDRILQNQHVINDLSLAYRWLVIKQLYGNNNEGYDLYIKGMSIDITKESAIKRLEQFKTMISEWDPSKVMDHRVLINDEYDLLDGRHRFVIEIYNGLSAVYCDMYKKRRGEIFAPAYANAQKLARNGFSDCEIEMLEKAMYEISHI